MVGEAADVDEALGLIESVSPSLAIVDISLRRGSGIQLIKDIQSRFPATKTLAATMHHESLYGERALRAGAKGFEDSKKLARP